MKKDEILLSEKHGVNPSIDVCFYCGESKGIILFGKLKGDTEAPRECCTSVEPCDKCKEKYNDYLLIVEKPSEEEDPTGRWFAIKKGAVPAAYAKSRVAFMLSEDFENIVSQVDHEGGEK